MLPGGQINWKHYHITIHALDRFVERVGLGAEWIIPHLDGAFIAYEDRTGFKKVQNFIAKAHERGGYVLMKNSVYFAIDPVGKTGLHVVKTVLAYANFINKAS